ncbi:Ankyrin repeat domain-containing protein 1 [Hondaea fermentalgiana]|uniref:Ankyrin repeat domain-containing protein 1 n=1 Tax=Hondaea fermentalgiana TaxID=2315210 RepID=A0A2R5GE48_9STRA|nr:Ankyrin repeat domain-containing protein 1 [Hondaea fermentalgiana]|eukprot:GBG29206.1 Ankyrin repeat domain-containing protein 1 [Hondaea fermentalgiana]
MPGRETKPVRALLIIDCQNDFIPSEDGSLAVPDAEAVLPVINKLRSKEFDFVYLCLDWHPYNHCSFRTNNPGADLFEVVHLPTTGNAQIMWPDHCVQGTHGAELHKDLKIEVSDIYTYAGCNPQRDSYSVFKDNGSTVLTEMRDLLEESAVTEIYAVGLATDYCVQYTLLDAKSLLQGVEVFFIQDGCRGISDAGVKGAVDAFKSEKVHIISSGGPELGRIADRKIRIDGGLELLKRNDRVTMFSEVDRIYESVIFRTAQGKAWEEDLANLVRSVIVNQLCSWSGKNALHACCEMGDIRTLEHLIRVAGKGLNLGMRTRKDENALMLAIQSKDPTHRADIVRLLLDTADEGQRRELLFGQSLQFRLSALMFACRDGLPDVVSILLEAECSSSLKLRSAFGKTALMFACISNTQDHAAIVEMLLRSQAKLEDRFAMLQETDKERWNSLHFSAKSGSFARVDWSRALDGYENMSRLPINAKTLSGITFLHLAAFNGRSEVIRALIDNCAPNRKRRMMEAILKKGLRHRVKVNVPIKGLGHTELDLAIQRRHLECARLLLRLGCYAGTSSQEQMQELLHRLVLMGDVEACESILNFADENRVTIDDALVETTQRIEHPETCTVSFANRTDPVAQFLYKCEICGASVCLVCKDRCHGPAACRQAYLKLDFEHFPDKGWEPCGTVVSQCGCDRDTCCATAATDVREIEGYRFIPHPVRTSAVHLNAELLRLSHSIARNMHNVWAQSLSELGWRYGRDKDPDEKVHPHLLPFDSLSIEGAKYNMDMSVETLKVILSLGYEIHRRVEAPRFGRNDTTTTDPSTTPNAALSSSSSREPVQQDPVMLTKALSMMASDSTMKQRKIKLGVTSADLLAGTGNKYSEFAWDISRPDCVPLNTSGVELPKELATLTERIASNSHEVWASEKIRQGWRYAPSRNIRKDLKLNSSLVPYYVLTREEKEQLLQGARETMKVILMTGWVVHPKTRASDSSGSKGPKTKFAAASRATNENDSDEGSSDDDDDNGDEDGMSGDTHGSGSERRNAGNQLMIPLRRRDTAQPTRSTLAFRQLKLIRRKLFNQYLFAAVRRGQIHSVNILLSKRSSMHVGANLNAIDEYGHTPLYIAIKRGQLATAKRLLALGANLELRDINGLTPLALCAYLGNLKLCMELVQNQARILVCDAMGFTPLHLAANQGHVEVCKYLTERLQQEHQSNEIVDLNADMVDYSAADALAEGNVMERDSDDEGSSAMGRSRRSFRTMATGSTNAGQAQARWKLFRIVFRSRAMGSERSKVGRIIPAEGLTASKNWQTDQVDQVSPLRRMPTRQSTRLSGQSEALFNQSTPREGIASVQTGLMPSRTTQKLLRSGSDLGEAAAQSRLSGYPPLSLAVQSDNIEIVELLIKYGANPMLADGPAAMFSPYVRALLRHIEMCAKVEYLQDRISRRALYDLQTAGTLRADEKPPNKLGQDGRKVGPGGASMRQSGSSLIPMDTYRGDPVSGDQNSFDYVDPNALNLTNRTQSQRTPGSMTPKSLPPIGIPGRKHFGMVKRLDTRIGNLFGFAGGEGGAQDMQERVAPDIGPDGPSGVTGNINTQQVSSTRELDQLLEKAQDERAKAARMVEVMNRSSKVSAWRRRTAIKMCVKETSLLLILIISFGCLVQLSPDYGIESEGEWADQLRGHLAESTASIDGPADFLDWVQHKFVGEELLRAANRTAWRGKNFVFGGIALDMYEHNALEELDNAQLTTIASLDTSTEYQTSLLPQADKEELLDILTSETGNWTQNEVHILSLTFNLYNPFYEVYGIAEVRQTSSFVGLNSLDVDVKPFRLHYGRFPPSRSFQLAVLIMVICFTITKLRSWVRARHRSRGRRTEEWVIEFLLLGILIFDIYVYEVTKDVTPDYTSSERLDLSQAYRLLEVERRFFAIYFLLSVLPLLKATQTIPSIGPVVVALLSTMTNTAVLIYLLVISTACFLLTLTFHVGFGISVSQFATMITTFESLFLTPFVETWDGIITSSHSSYLGAVLAVFYILFATISLNLLIAIVTDVYPSARAASDREWEEIITGGIEDNLRDLLHRQNISQKDLRIETWNEAKLLTGRDGRKHWVASDAVNDDEGCEAGAPAMDGSSSHQSTNDKLAALSEQIRQLTSIVESLRAAPGATD